MLNFIFLYWPQYPAGNTEFSSEFLELEQLNDLGSALLDALQGEPDEKLSRYCRYSFFFIGTCCCSSLLMVALVKLMMLRSISTAFISVKAKTVALFPGVMFSSCLTLMKLRKLTTSGGIYVTIFGVL